MTPLLIANHLSYALEKKMLLREVSLRFDGGFLHGILGPNGSGKSTLLKNLAGIWRPTSGSILWNGAPLLCQSRQAISQTISFVPQQPQLSFDFLVEEVVAMGRYPYQSAYWNAKEDKPVIEALHLVDVWNLRHRHVNQLSQGEKQRVYIARALATEAPVLLLDEPTACLDIRHQLEIWDLLHRLVEKGKIVVISTHDLLLAEQHCDRIAVLNQGTCVGEGSFSSLVTPLLLQEVFGVNKHPSSAEGMKYAL